MNKLKQYKSQIFTFVTIFLLATYGIFPALTAANTIYNIIGSIGLLLLVVWGALELFSCFTPFETDVKISETPLEIKPSITPKNAKEMMITTLDDFKEKPKRKPKSTK
jgi:hypothetical protein